MKYYSEKTKEIYDKVDDLKTAEKAYDAKEAEKAMALKAQQEKEAKLKEERAFRAKEIEDAIKELEAARKKVNDLKAAFVKDYGSYHYTYKIDDFNGEPRFFFKWM